METTQEKNSFTSATLRLVYGLTNRDFRRTTNSVTIAHSPLIKVLLWDHRPHSAQLKLVQVLVDGSIHLSQQTDDFCVDLWNCQNDCTKRQTGHLESTSDY
mmetsp:Transcript_13369/g.24223  ORF Transcript_13369/g.24223 Transcript_13369/m.24223 type:complete len:101 (+) Transcript_13369:99-401(+)